MSYVLENVARQVQNLDWAFQNFSKSVNSNVVALATLGSTVKEIAGNDFWMAAKLNSNAAILGLSLYILVGSLVLQVAAQNASQNGKSFRSGVLMGLMAVAWPAMIVAGLTYPEKIFEVVEERPNEEFDRIRRDLAIVDGRIEEFDRRFSGFLRSN